MKTRFISFAILFFAGILLGGCDIDKNEASEPLKKGLTMTLNASVSFSEEYDAFRQTIANIALEEGVGSGTQQQNRATANDSLGHGGIARAMDVDGHKYFSKGDQVAFVYTNIYGEVKVSLSNEYNSETDPDIKSAHFWWLVEDADYTKDFTVIYPATMCKEDGTVNYDSLRNQDGTFANISRLDLATSTNSWKFVNDGRKDILENIVMDNPLAICKFTVLDKDSNDVTSTITNFCFGDGKDDYVINRKAEEGPIYVIIKPHKNHTFVFYTKVGNDLCVKTVTGKTIEADNIYPIRMTIEKMEEFGALLPGVFSSRYTYWRVHPSRDGRKGSIRAEYRHFKCRFSRGNLLCKSKSRWNFAKNQWEYVGQTDEHGYTAYSGSSYMDLFGWSTKQGRCGLDGGVGDNASKYKNCYWFSSDRRVDEGDFAEWTDFKEFEDGEKLNWYTLDNRGWYTILFTRNASTVNGVENARYAKGNVNGVHGLILFPDAYIHPAGVKAPEDINNRGSGGWQHNDYRGDDWKKMEYAGAVFLPASGWRDNDNAFHDFGTVGRYWTSSFDEKVLFSMRSYGKLRGEDVIIQYNPQGYLNKVPGAECILFKEGSLQDGNDILRSEGCAVRLVNEVDNRKIYHDCRREAEEKLRHLEELD